MSKRIRTTKSPALIDGLDGAALKAPVPTTSPSPSGPEGLARGRASSTGSLGKGKGTANGNAQGGDGPNGKHVMLPAFLSKTYEIFSMPEFAAICGWNASGDTIIVSQLEAFVSMVLPRFFKHRNFPSFVRQLNLYGFHKTVLDSKRLEFQHPYFKRDRPDLLHFIKRKVSSGGSSGGQQQGGSRLDAHREVSDQLLKEMKELRHKSDAMEKRLRELEIDNAIVRSDNLKLWKHLESAKDKQLIMQEKMKKIMWILFQIYRGKQTIPKLGGHGQEDVISDDYINSSRLGPKEFRDVLRFLAMDEPPLLPNSSSAAVDSATLTSRKRKFVEVPDSTDNSFGSHELFKIAGPSPIVELPNPLRENSSLNAFTAPMEAAPPTSSADPSNNILSIFSPQLSLPRISQPTASATAPSDSNTTAVTVPTAATETSTTATHTDTGGTSAARSQALDFIDEDLPLLTEEENYSFGENEEHVMKKLEDFETSLLDEYDVGCLDTLLQQLKTGNAEKLPITLPLDSDEIAVGGPEDASESTT